MSDDELRDELITLLVAGHETTATALAWAFERDRSATRASRARLLAEIDGAAPAAPTARAARVPRRHPQGGAAAAPLDPRCRRTLAAPDGRSRGYAIPAGHARHGLRST